VGLRRDSGFGFIESLNRKPIKKSKKSYPPNPPGQPGQLHVLKRVSGQRWRASASEVHQA
jgi:hypothetical protein